MVNKWYLVLFIGLWAAHGAQAAVYERAAGAPPHAAVSSVADPPVARLSLFAGADILVIPGHTSVGPALALRLYAPESAMERMPPLFIELGGVLPHPVASDFREDTPIVDGKQYRAGIANLSEAHLALGGEIPHGTEGWIIPEASLGVSALIIKNEATRHWTVGPTPYWDSADSKKVSFGPRVRFGVTLRPWRLPVSIHFEAAYVHYADSFSFQGRDFDLGLSGWSLGPSLEVRL